MNIRRMGRVLSAGVLLAAATLLPGQTATAQAPLSQVQVARRFLLAVVGGEWEAAYGWLAPEVRLNMSRPQFQQALQPFQVQVGRYGKAISLYKLGYRLRGTEVPEPFVGFSFQADTLTARPHFQLDVTFRDSTARQVQGFGLIPLSEPVK